nr:hypothetical protein [Fusobacterium necrophorum]
MSVNVNKELYKHYAGMIRACKNACYYRIEGDEILLGNAELEEIARIELLDVSVALEQYFSNKMNKFLKLKGVKK